MVANKEELDEGNGEFLPPKYLSSDFETIFYMV
jgi:hypothetical protein